MKKNIFHLKILSFTVFFGLLLLKFCCCCKIDTAFDFEGLFAVTLTGDFFPRLYKFEVSIVK